MNKFNKTDLIKIITLAEDTAWNNYQEAQEANGCCSTLTYAMKNRHAAIRDLMDDLLIDHPDK